MPALKPFTMPKNPPADDTLMTLGEAALLLGYNRTALSSYRASGHLTITPAVQTQTVALFTWGSIVEWARNRPGVGYRSDLRDDVTGELISERIARTNKAAS